MSVKEIERFQLDVRADQDLVQRIKDGGFGLDSITTTARSEGYDFDLGELKSYIKEQSAGNLTDEQLSTIAAAGSTWTSTNTVIHTSFAGVSRTAVAITGIGWIGQFVVI